MKKLGLALLICGTMLVGLTGCLEKKEEAPKEAEVVQISIPNNFDPSNANVSSPAAFFGEIEKLKTTGNKTIMAIADAALEFNNIESELAFGTKYENLPYKSVNYGDVELRIPDFTKTDKMIATAAQVSDYQDKITQVIIPKLTNAISKLALAESYNQILVLPKAQVGNMNVKITPAHIKMIRSQLTLMKGILYFVCAYDLNATIEQRDEFNKRMESPIPENVTNVGEYMFGAFSNSFLTVKNNAYAVNSKNDIVAGLQVLIDGLNEMPTNNLVVVDENYKITGQNKPTEEMENILSIPATIRNNFVRDLRIIKSSITEIVMIRAGEGEIRITLNPLFGMNIRNMAITLLNEITAEQQLANETFDGILPDGFKVTLDKVKPGAWDAHWQK